MSSIDQRVVQVTFDNKQFEIAVQQSRDSLGRFTKGLQVVGQAKGLNDVGEAANKISFDKLASGIDSISSHFKALSVIGITALSSLTTKALDAGLSIAKSLTIDPIKAGFDNYETQIKAVQTILANTQSEGVKLKDVNAVLAELNTYANQTVYNFSDMTKNIGTFTAAGVNLKDSVASIKGIANLAAMSGSTSEQASTAMYQLSQAIAAGTVHLQDWNSVVNAGMGGKTFQTALINTARASGVAIDSIIKKAGSFRESLQKGWLTSNILVKTLSQFTGDLSQKQLEAMGFTKKQAEDIQKMGQTAVDAATKIKTMSQLTDALKEEVATAWATIFKTIFGNINQATDLFSGIHNVAENALTGPIYALNKLVEGWDKLGGRVILIDAVKLAFQALSQVIHVISSAFREIFPPTTAQQLVNITKSIHVFAENLKMGGETAKELQRTFKGVFAVLDIGWQIVKAVVKTIFDLFGAVSNGSGGFLKVTASIGDFLVNLDKSIKQGQILTKFFGGLEKVLRVPIQLLQILGQYIGSLFDKFDGQKAEKALTGVAAKIGPIGQLAQLARDAWSEVLSRLGAVAKFFEPLAQKFDTFFKNLGQTIVSSLSQMNFGDVLNTINTGLFAGIVVLLKGFLGKFTASSLSPFGGITHTLTEAVEGFTNTLKVMQGTLKAATLLEIAAAIGILTISLSVLSKIDSNGLIRASTAISVMFGQLLASLALMQKAIGTAGFAKLPFITGSLLLLAGAVDLLSVSVLKLAGLDWNSLAKGLTGLGGILAALLGSLKLMPPPAGLISAGLGMIALAAGIRILVGAVASLSGLSWEGLAKGLVGVGALLASLALFSKFSAVEKGGVLQGAGIILLATGIKILASAMKDLGQLSWESIAKGIVSMAGALVLIGAALILIPPTSVLSAAAVLIVAASLSLVADALGQMGQQSWGSIAKGLVELAGALVLIGAALVLLPPTSLLSAAAIFIVASSLGMIADALAKMGGFSWSAILKSLVELAVSLGIIAAAMILMTEALPGAAALLVVAGALQVLLPVLQAFGQMSWGEIGKSLLMLAGVFVVLGAAGLVLGPLVPILIGLGAAVTLLGVGMLAAGAGVFLFATGLTALAAAGAAGAAAIVAIVSGLIGLLPTVAKEIGLALIVFAQTIAAAGPAILKAIVTVLDALISAIVKETPKIVKALLSMLTMLLQQLAIYVPKMVVAGMHLITGVLNGIAANIGKMVTAATNVVVNFLNGIANNLPRVIQAGVNLIIKFINGVSTAIKTQSAALGAAGGNLAVAIVEGMVKGMGAGIGVITNAAKKLASSALQAAKHVLGIASPSKEFFKIGQFVNEGFYNGLTSGNAKNVDKAFQSLRDQLASTINASSKQIDSLETKLKKLESARHKNRTEIANTKAELSSLLSEHKKEIAAYDLVTKGLTKQHKALDTLSNKYDTVTAKLKAANDTLANAIKTRDDYNKQITDQYSTLPTISTGETLATYENDLSTQIEKTKEFANVLQRLRKLGLSDTAYKQLLSMGIDALPFAQELLNSGKAGVTHLNDLNKQLSTAASALGKTASTDLYQAAVNSAQGLVDGLKKQQKALEKQMEVLADAMVNAIKKKLKIKSPSRVFSEIGGFSAQGLANGFTAASAVVEKSASAMGYTAMSSLKDSLSQIPDLVSSKMDINPTITPVLDLSGVKKDAGQIGSMLQTQSLSVASAYAKAANVSAGYASNAAANAAQTSAVTQTPTKIEYNQYNTSPVALSSAEIYRQTKNQLSTVRGALVYQTGSSQL